ncbi:MAG TPA: hypothetical protein VHE35_24585, partial [Kofleriaceae bacterium]|nr:hypothetical protein [Kofleriaceae bacterium]
MSKLRRGAGAAVAFGLALGACSSKPAVHPQRDGGDAGTAGTTPAVPAVPVGGDAGVAGGAVA